MQKASLKKLAVIAPVVGAVVFCAGVAVHGQVATQTSKPKAKAAAKLALDLNTATTQELQELPGVGEATARKIIAGRPYSSVDDLAKAGVTARTLDGIRSLVRVGAMASKTKSKTTTAATEKGTGKVNVNTAEIAELEALPGVGAAIAKAIVAGRPWKSVEDLEKIRGLGRGPRFRTAPRSHRSRRRVVVGFQGGCREGRIGPRRSQTRRQGDDQACRWSEGQYQHRLQR